MYDQAVKDISTALSIGVVVEELDLTEKQIEDISTWLAGESIGKIA